MNKKPYNKLLNKLFNNGEKSKTALFRAFRATDYTQNNIVVLVY